MKKARLLFTAIALLLSVFGAYGQSTVKGIVVASDDGLPVIGASVFVKGSPKTGTVTDLDGAFTLSVPSSARFITVSFMGYHDAEVPVSPEVRVVLKEDSEMLEQVVVTGMQKMDRRLFTGATARISAEDTRLDGVADVSRSLEGRAAGVSVQNVSGTFGTAPKIRVRGATSIYGSSKPLWVVDGVIMEDVTEVGADELSSGDAVTLISSAIAGINADDIESFQILKDGSATSIYGARAMAGVIVVTTRKGHSGSDRISYTGEFSTRLIPSYRDFNIMNSQEQMSVYREMESAGYLNFAETYRASDSGVYGKMYHLINSYDPVSGSFGLANTEAARNAYLREAEYRNTDWFKELFSMSISQNHAVSMASGTEKASYYVSLSTMQDPGWYKTSGVKRYTANINALYNISRRLSLNLIGNASYRQQEAPGTLGQSTDVVSGQVRRDFDINPYSYALNTSRTLDPDEYYSRNYADFNIMHELANNHMNLDVVDMKWQAELKYRPLSKLELSALVAFKFSATSQTHIITENSNQAMAYRAMGDATIRDANSWLYTDPDNENSLPVTVLPAGGFHTQTNYRMKSSDFRATASYNDTWAGSHIVNLFGGMETNAVDRTRSFFNGVGMQYDMGMLAKYDYRYFKQLAEENGSYYSVNETRTRSAAFFTTGTYSYKGRYTVNGTIRYEGTNKLGRSRKARWLPTWNVSGAWNMHEEEWFHNKNAVSNLTIKASYSLTADRGPANVTNSLVVIQSYNPWRPFTDVSESGLNILDLENSELTYEKKHELNIGVAAGFLGNRINIEADWYVRNNFDLIGIVNTMGIGGQISKYANVASMSSCGAEFTLSTRTIDARDFRWSTDFIFSDAVNRVNRLMTNARVIDMVTGNGFTMAGYPVRSLFSLNFQGLNDEGLPTFINEKGDVTTSDIYFQEIDSKKHLIYEGPTDPTINGSFGNVFSYKGLRLNVFMTYSFGNVIRLSPVFKNRYSDLDAMPKEFSHRWVVSGDEDVTDIPVIASRRQNAEDPYLSFAYNAYNYSTVRTAKGDFIRMKEISLTYALPKSWVEPLRLRDLSLKLQATNLFLVYADKKLNGQDPEFYNAGGVASPMPKQLTFTIRMSL